MYPSNFCEEEENGVLIQVNNYMEYHLDIH